MTRKYSLVIEGDESGYSAYVSELPTILVSGRSLEEIATRAKEAVRIFLSSVQEDCSPTLQLREIELDVSART